MERINTQQNKSMIWDILYKNNIFDNLADHDMPNIINIIDNVIINTEQNISNKNRNLIELNKIIIQDVNILINQYKIKNSTNNTNSTNSTNSTSNKTIKSILKSEIRETIDDRFNIIKNDLDNTINISKPQEINFKDDISYNNTNLDKDLEELIKRRNNINNNLSLIYDKKTEINTDTTTNTSPDTSTNIESRNNINNKILDFDNIISSKIDNSSQTNQYDTSLNTIKIIELLEAIKINQDKILNLINK